MRKKIVIISAVILTLALASSFLVFGESERKKKEDLYKKLELFSDALSIVQNEYAEETKPDALITGAIKGMLSSLDAYSEYLTPDEHNELKSDTEGRFGGLGIEIAIKDSVLTVVSPIEDTPAWRAGIKAGDRIVKINNEPTKSITITEAVKKLRGAPGTQVDITLLREGVRVLLEMKLTRDIIKIKDLKNAMILEDGVGYVRLAEFRENTPRDLDAVLSKLKKDGMDSLILDLRNNPGGLLDVAVKVVEKFIPEGKLIVYTKGRDPQQNLEFKSNGGFFNKYLDMPLIILVNEGSASGSEIVAGALQDYKRALVTGKKTFGKGSVQSVLPLSDSSALKLTTSKYFTPLGRVIHNAGINPDVVIDMPMAEVTSEVKKADDILEAVPSVFDYKKDNQIVRSLDIMKGIKVYTQNAR